MIRLHLLHIHHTPNTITRMHIMERLVDPTQILAMSDEFVHLQLTGHVVVDETRQLGAALDAAESAAFPAAASDELEGCGEEEEQGQYGKIMGESGYDG